jgi:hypothetical protein
MNNYTYFNNIKYMSNVDPDESCKKFAYRVKAVDLENGR